MFKRLEKKINLTIEKTRKELLEKALIVNAGKVQVIDATTFGFRKKVLKSIHSGEPSILVDLDRHRFITNLNTEVCSGFCSS